MNYRDYNYGSTPLGGHRTLYGENTYREYEKESYHPKDYVEEMKDNYKRYNEQKQYATRDLSMQGLNDTLESIVNVIAMLKKEARSPHETDLIRRYITTINNL